MANNRRPLSLKDYKTAPFILGTMRMGHWGRNMNASEIESFFIDQIQSDVPDHIS